MREWILTHARGAFWIWAGAGIAAIFALVSTGLMEPLTAWCYYLAWALAGAVAINFGASLGLRPAAMALDKGCDPLPLLAYCQKVLAQNPKSTIYRVYEGFALLMLGRRAEAGASLALVEDHKRLWKNPKLAWMYCVCRIDLAEEEAQAGPWLDRLEKMAAAKQAGAGRVLEEQRACLALRRGETRGVERVCLEALERAPAQRIRVAWHWELAKLCRLEGRGAEAREHLEYAVEHGNRLYIKAEAEALLAELK